MYLAQAEEITNKLIGTLIEVLLCVDYFSERSCYCCVAVMIVLKLKLLIPFMLGSTVRVSSRGIT